MCIELILVSMINQILSALNGQITGNSGRFINHFFHLFDAKKKRLFQILYSASAIRVNQWGALTLLF